MSDTAPHEAHTLNARCLWCHCHSPQQLYSLKEPVLEILLGSLCECVHHVSVRWAQTAS